jgi:hypothetical protein
MNGCHLYYLIFFKLFFCKKIKKIYCILFFENIFLNNLDIKISFKKLRIRKMYEKYFFTNNKFSIKYIIY